MPLWLKLAYTAFMAVLVPVYWHYYGPTNFLYFCDVALFLTLVGIWLESPLLISMCAVGILVPQAVWVVGFLVEPRSASRSIGMTDYMFDAENSLFLRGLSLFHGWLPFLLVYLVWRLGYDRRALAGLDRAGLGADADLLLLHAAADPESRADAGQHQLRLGTERHRRADLGVALRLARRADDRPAAAAVRAGALSAGALRAEAAHAKAV